MESTTQKKSLRETILIVVLIVVVSLLLMYACSQKSEAEKLQLKLTAEIVKTDAKERDCRELNQSLQMSIDSLKMQLTTFESLLNSEQQNDASLHSESNN
jgi:signal transduction histidine kinase